MAEGVGACGGGGGGGGGGGTSIQNQAAAPQRRPRVREVSSRFMTPSASHCSASSLSPVPNQKQRSNSVQRQRSTTPSSYADQNTNDLNRSPPPHQQRKQPTQPRAVAKLVFKDNRPDTPTTTTTTRPRQQQCYLSSSSSSSSNHLSAASKLLHSSGLSSSSSTCLETAHSVNDNINNNQLVRSLPDLRSSAPDAETSRTCSRATPCAIVVSSRYLTEKTNARVPPSSTTTASSTPTPYSPCSRSLHLPRTTNVGGDRKYYNNNNNNNLVKVGLPLPPPPPLPLLYTKPASTADVPKRSGKRVPGGLQEDAHLLKLLHNRCLQWRFLNAKSQAFIHSQSIESERTLYSINIKIEEQRELLTRKQTELSQLQRMRTLSKILEVQMPYLDEWLTFEGDFSISLSEAIQSLLNASVQLPVSGNVKADIADVQEALDSSMKLMESMVLYVSDLLQKTEQIEILVSELARLSGGERALIGECGDLLSGTYQSQVEEGSLQCQLIQLFRSLHG